MELGKIKPEEYTKIVDTVKSGGGEVYFAGNTDYVSRKVCNAALALANSEIAWCRKMIRTAPPTKNIVEEMLIAMTLDMIETKKKKLLFARDLLRNIIEDAGPA